MDDTYSRILSPKITSLAFPEEEICTMTVQLILNASGKKDGFAAKEILLSPSLVTRDSVSTPRSE